MQNCIKNINDFFICYKKAVWDKSVDLMVNLYHNEVLIFDMWGVQGFSSGLKDWYFIVENWLTSFNEEKVNVKFDMIEIHEGDSIAFAGALIEYEAISADNTVIRSMRNRISLGFIKTEGFWKVKHQHTSAPIDSDLKAIFNI